MGSREMLGESGRQTVEVLIVDDEENVRNVFRDYCLSSSSFRVTTAPGGREAIDLIRKHDFDVVTIDLVMPEVSGIDTIEAIRREWPHLPVVVVTGNATEWLIEEVGRYGGCRVVRKPIGIQEFLDELLDIVAERRRPDNG